ncbi:28S ribosomal protein S5, mitochondrial [Lecanora helva]
MNSTHSLRCAFSKCARPNRYILLRNFTSSTPNAFPPPNRPEKQYKSTAEDYKQYTDEEKEILKKSYTPEQISALEAGEAAIDPKDIASQGTFREDSFAFPYMDDFSKIHPLIDKPVLAPKENNDPKQRFKNEDEVATDLAKMIEDLPEKPTRLDYMKWIDNYRLTVGKEEAERNPRSYLAPEIPKGLEALQRRGLKVGEADIDPAMKRLMKQTGFSFDAIKKFRVKNLVTHRVVNQTRMGKIQSIYYLTIAGNGKGLLGIGEGKSAEPEDARRQAHFNAIRNLQPIPRYEERTIFGNVKVKFGAVELELMTRPPGFGIRCQDKIFEMCRAAGISDLAARVTRSRNPMNTIKATFQALISQRLPDEVARGLGKKLVDVRKVYYAGNV